MFNSINKALTNSGVQTLETFAFIMIDLMDEEPECELAMGVAIRFKGKHSGILEAWADKVILNSIYETIMGGEDTSDNQTGIENCLKEIVNIVAGNFLTECFGFHELSELHLPERREVFEKLENHIWVTDMETEGKLLFQVKLEND